LLDPQGVRPGLVSRLDKDTSGVARRRAVMPVRTCASSAGCARVGRVAKQYLAIVCGTPRPAEGSITLALGHDPVGLVDRRRSSRIRQVLRAETRYRVRWSRGSIFAFVESILVTGRTHQISSWHLAARRMAHCGRSYVWLS